MPRTDTEKRIIQERRMQAKGGLVVPYLHELLKKPLKIETDEDARMLYNLAREQIKRDKERKSKYDKGEMVFSPSGLADCMRRVFLSKNHQKFGLERVELPKIEPHYYFFTGDFIHLKWQFAFYKLSLMFPKEIFLVDCEIPVMSKRKDHGGTLDVLVLVNSEAVIVDAKGLNVRAFNQVDKQSTSHKYRIQIVDYGMLFNSELQRGKYVPPPKAMHYLKQHYGITEFPKVKRVVVLAENKGGPDMNHPAAITEQIFDLNQNLPEIRARLELLREYDQKEEIPEAECQSTRTVDFTGCPFAHFCFEEVKKNEAKRAKAGAAKRLEISRPKRRSRP